MGVPTGAAAQRPANTSCCTRMREDSFMLQPALVSTSALETRLMKEGGFGFGFGSLAPDGALACARMCW